MSCVVIKKEFDYHTENENSQLQPTPLANTYNKAIKKTTRKFAEMTIAFTYHSLFDSNKIFINKEKPKFVKVKQFDSLEIDKIENVINKSFNLSYIINNEIKTVYLSKNISKSQIFMETFSASSDIINNEEMEGEAQMKAIEEIERKINTVYKVTTVGFSIVASVSLISMLGINFIPSPIDSTLFFTSIAGALGFWIDYLKKDKSGKVEGS